MTIFIGILVWIVCGILHYPIFRAFMTTDGLAWTVADRILAIVGGLLGPIALVASILSYCIFRKGNSKPAKW